MKILAVSFLLMISSVAEARVVAVCRTPKSLPVSQNSQVADGKYDIELVLDSSRSAVLKVWRNGYPVPRMGETFRDLERTSYSDGSFALAAPNYAFTFHGRTRPGPNRNNYMIMWHSPILSHFYNHTWLRCAKIRE